MFSSEMHIKRRGGREKGRESEGARVGIRKIERSLSGWWQLMEMKLNPHPLDRKDQIVAVAVVNSLLFRFT